MADLRFSSSFFQTLSATSTLDKLIFHFLDRLYRRGLMEIKITKMPDNAGAWLQLRKKEEDPPAFQKDIEAFVGHCFQDATLPFAVRTSCASAKIVLMSAQSQTPKRARSEDIALRVLDGLAVSIFETDESKPHKKNHGCRGMIHFPHGLRGQIVNQNDGWLAMAMVSQTF